MSFQKVQIKERANIRNTKTMLVIMYGWGIGSGRSLKKKKKKKTQYRMRKWKIFIISPSWQMQLLAQIQTMEPEPDIMKRFQFHEPNFTTEHKHMQDHLVLTLRHESMESPRKKRPSHQIFSFSHLLNKKALPKLQHRLMRGKLVSEKYSCKTQYT